jgi:hypothetical protein
MLVTIRGTYNIQNWSFGNEHFRVYIQYLKSGNNSLCISLNFVILNKVSNKILDVSGIFTLSCTRAFSV